MSYRIDITGGGPVDQEQVREAFRELVRALDAATVEGGLPCEGTIRGMQGSEDISMDAVGVRVVDSDADRTAAAEGDFQRQLEEATES